MTVAVTCYTCNGICLGHESIEVGDSFKSTSGNVWVVEYTKDTEFGQYASVHSVELPADSYYWHTDSLRLMERVA